MELCVVKVTKGNRNHESQKLFYWPYLTKSLGLKVSGVHALPVTAIARRRHDLASFTRVKQRWARFGLGWVTASGDSFFVVVPVCICLHFFSSQLYP